MVASSTMLVGTARPLAVVAGAATTLDPLEDDVGDAEGVEAAKNDDILESVPPVTVLLWYPDEKGVWGR